MRTKVSSKLLYAVNVVEIAIGICLLIACIICSLGLVIGTDLSALFSDSQYFQDRINQVYFVIIGVELIKMIINHTLDSVVDVLMLAIARQMIIQHTSPMENLLAVIAVAILFIVRKYLYISKLDKNPANTKESSESESKLSENSTLEDQGARPIE